MFGAMAAEFQLWGTFSVADHKRNHAFVSDVLVYDRLVIPVPAGDDDDRWARNNWDVDMQASTLEALRDGNADRVVEVPWDRAKRNQYKERTADLAAAAAFDISTIESVARDNPDTPAQYVTRTVLQDYMDATNDARLMRGVMRGLPRIDVQVVAAYPSLTRLTAETNIEEAGAEPADGADLLGGFAWPFLVPAENDRTDLDLLKRAVEFANQPEVSAYRLAYHRWRSDVVLTGKTPQQAAERLGEQIAAYGDWSRTLKTRTRTRTACAVVSVGASVVGSALFPFIGVPALAVTAVGASGAGASLVDLVASRTFRRRAKVDPGHQVGALFWEAAKAIN
jgi:hypothetical protein